MNFSLHSTHMFWGIVLPIFFFCSVLYILWHFTLVTLISKTYWFNIDFLQLFMNPIRFPTCGRKTLKSRYRPWSRCVPTALGSGVLRCDLCLRVWNVNSMYTGKGDEKAFLNFSVELYMYKWYNSLILEAYSIFVKDLWTYLF